MATRTLEYAETEEELTQAALSGRRFIEQLANYLFPAQNEKWRSRNVVMQSIKSSLGLS